MDFDNPAAWSGRVVASTSAEPTIQKEPVLRFMGHTMAVFNLQSLKSFEALESPSRRPAKHASQSGLSMNCSCLRALNDLASEQLESGRTKQC